MCIRDSTNYNKDNYPDDQRVKVLEHPAGMKASTVGALEDFATGIRDADAMQMCIRDRQKSAILSSKACPAARFGVRADRLLAGTVPAVWRCV